MSLDLDAANSMIGGLRTYPVAVTTISRGRTNGLMSLSAGMASIVPEAPRITISLTKYNFTHDLVLDSGVYCVHVLASAPDQIEASLAILMALGGSSGRDGDKLAKLRTQPGVTGSPILLDSLCYVEARVVKSFDADENTIFLADVVAALRLRNGRPLDINEAWSKLPKQWIEDYERSHLPQVESARRYRGLMA